MLVGLKFNWFCTVNYLIKDDFEQFIKNAYKNRETKVNLRRNLDVQALPEFVKLFKNSQSVSRK